MVRIITAVGIPVILTPLEPKRRAPPIEPGIPAYARHPKRRTPKCQTHPPATPMRVATSYLIATYLHPSCGR